MKSGYGERIKGKGSLKTLNGLNFFRCCTATEFLASRPDQVGTSPRLCRGRKKLGRLCSNWCFYY